MSPALMVMRDIKRRWREYVVNTASDHVVERWNYWKKEYFRVEDENRRLREENEKLRNTLFDDRLP